MYVSEFTELVLVYLMLVAHKACIGPGLHLHVGQPLLSSTFPYRQ